MKTNFKFTLQGTYDLVNQINIKFTGKSQMTEAQLGELSTLQPIATGVFGFMNSDPQHLGSATFNTPISNEDGTRVLPCNTFGNMFVNQFAVIKRIELTGGFSEVSADSTSLFVGNPVVTGQLYQGGLCTTHRDDIVFTPDNMYVAEYDLKKGQLWSRYYWEGEMPWCAFTSLIIGIKSVHDLVRYTGVTFYFDELHPMTHYPEWLRKWKSFSSEYGCAESETEYTNS